MRLRAQSYHNLDGTSATGVSVRWYWRLLASAAYIMILGGFLMLPVTFENDPALRVSKVGLGIFALAVLVAGLAASILAFFLVRDLHFRATAVLQPALISCALGFLTIFYNIIISGRYAWSALATAITIVSALAAITYAGLLFWTHRKMKSPAHKPLPGIQIAQEEPSAEEANRWQSPQYYQNYIKNMFPSAAVSYESTTLPHEPSTITEEEMQRQQMLMLLLRQDQAPIANSSSNTFRIEWQGHEHEGDTPVNGYYTRRTTGLNSVSVYSQSAYNPSSSSAMSVRGVPAWDGVWRNIAQQPSNHSREPSREDRRRQIEMGH